MELPSTGLDHSRCLFNSYQFHSLVLTYFSHLFTLCTYWPCHVFACSVSFAFCLMLFCFFLACLSSSEGIDFWVLLQWSKMTASRKVLSCYFLVWNLGGLRLRLKTHKVPLWFTGWLVLTLLLVVNCSGFIEIVCKG